MTFILTKQMKMVASYQHKATIAKNQMVNVYRSNTICPNCKADKLQNLRDDLEFNIDASSNILDNCDFPSPLLRLFQENAEQILAILDTILV
jgi:hypothetical protein